MITGYIKLQKGKELQPPAIVVKRSVYEHLGGFYAVHYGEDWEMWIRIAAHYPVAYSPKCLALYRSGQALCKHYRQSIMSGQNIKDIYKVINITQKYLPQENRKQYRQTAKKNFAIHYAKAANRIYYIIKSCFYTRLGSSENAFQFS